MSVKEIVIYTDGACSGNPGPGGWAAILFYQHVRKELVGYLPHTTNNIMELTAAVEALESLKEKCNVKLYSDSRYLIDGMKSWLKGWIKKNWKKSNNDVVKNREIWERLALIEQKHQIEWIWVKGHDENEFNSQCDELAREQIVINSNK